MFRGKNRNSRQVSESLQLEAERTGSRHQKKLRYFFYYARLIVVALVLAVLVKETMLEAYNIPSESMRNTLLVGDFLLAEKLTFGPKIPFTDLRLPGILSPEPGDVIVFKSPEDTEKSYIKRVVAVGGDRVEIVDKVVYVNGEAVDDSRFVIHSDPTLLPRTAAYPRDNFGPITVPDDHYFVLGDNRDNSSDSRFWGCVPRELVTGRAILIHWSWRSDPNAPDVSLTNPLSFLRSVVYHVRAFPDHVRWGRVFTTIE